MIQIDKIDALAAREINARMLTDGMVPVRVVAGHLGIHRATVYDMIHRGELPTVTVGKKLKIPVAAVREYTASRYNVGLGGKKPGA